MLRRAGLVLLALAASGCGKKANIPPPLVWHSIAEGEALARREHKLALIFFGAEWSTADKELERVTFPAPEVRHELASWVAIKVDVTDDEDREVSKTKTRFGMLGDPMTVAIDFDAPNPERSPLFVFYEFVKPAKMAVAIREAGAIAAQRRAAGR